MMRDIGDKKMQEGDTATRIDARGSRRSGKTRLSPELQELMHMLSSLEHQFNRDETGE